MTLFELESALKSGDYKLVIRLLIDLATGDTTVSKRIASVDETAESLEWVLCVARCIISERDSLSKN